MAPTQTDFVQWQFFDAKHRPFKAELDAWCAAHLADQELTEDRAAVDARCIALVRRLGQGGWLAHAVAGTAHGGKEALIDTRCLCLLRETLAYHEGLADFAFAMQGLGSGAISLLGTTAQQAQYLPGVVRGERIAAFALSEPEAGSDVAALQCSATALGQGYELNGRKTWISNGGIADFYLVFARTGEAPGARGMSASMRRRRSSAKPLSRVDHTEKWGWCSKCVAAGASERPTLSARQSSAPPLAAAAPTSMSSTAFHSQGDADDALWEPPWSRHAPAAPALWSGQEREEERQLLP